MCALSPRPSPNRSERPHCNTAGGVGGHSVYIDTEGSFTSVRAEEMSKALLASLHRDTESITVETSDSSTVVASQAASQTAGLTEAQREKIAANRAAALRKRKASTEREREQQRAAVEALDVDLMLSR